ncbi:MAG: ABATE domain-containing protein [Chloroflexi bacterium]|nr:ABATE domain-containing protein [Chloroflexota bacterium]
MPQRLGGRVCLDFANTIVPRGGPTPYTPPAGAVKTRRDCLEEYRDLVAWALGANLLTEDQALRTLDEASRPEIAREVFERGVTLREALYRLFWTIARGGQPDRYDLACLRAEYVQTFGGATLQQVGRAYRWRWHPDAGEPDGILWPVAHSAVELLTLDEPDRVKVCPGAGGPIPCGWLFYDESRNQARQWCSMEKGCGKRVKARRQNTRRRST